MSVVCVAGVQGAALADALRALQARGFAAAKPLARDPSISFDSWHDRLVAQHHAEEDHITRPGRLWDQLAGDLLFENLRTPQWCWAHTQGLRLVDYWAGFDPSIRFIILVQPLAQWLTGCFAQGSTGFLLESALNRWQGEHRRALVFHKQHPKRVALVYAESGSSWIDDAAAALALNMSDSRPADQTEQTLDPQVQARGPDPEVLSRYLSELWLPHVREQGHDIEKLERELGRAVVNRKARRSKSFQPSLQDLVRSRAAASAAAMSTSSSRGETSKAIDESAFQSLREALHEAQQENEILSRELHDVQENFERHLLNDGNAQRQLQSHLNRTERVLRSTPYAYDMDGISCNASPMGVDTFLWEVRGLRLGSRVWSVLEFESVVESGVAGFRIRRELGTAGPLLRWPTVAAQHSDILLSPARDDRDGGVRAATLLQLAASDWDLAQTLPRLVTKAIDEHLVALPGQGTARTLKQAMARSQQMMARIPPLVRFNVVTLKGYAQSSDRAVMALELQQMSYAGRRVERFEFQLQAHPQTAGGLAPQFGCLILGEETATSPIELWRANTTDKQGRPVLALAVSETGVDSAAWASLSRQDQAFVQALFDMLALAFIALQAEGQKVGRPWRDWIDWASRIRQMTRMIATAGDPAKAPATVPVKVPANVTESVTAKVPPAPPARRLVPKLIHEQDRAVKPGATSQDSPEVNPDLAREVLKARATRRKAAVG